MYGSLEAEAPEVMAGAFEALRATAFVCDPQGVVRALTPAAEALVTSGRVLTVCKGRLKALYPADAAKLDRALAAAAANETAPLELLVRAVGAGKPLRLQVASLPKRRGVPACSAAVLVVAVPPRVAEGRRPLLQSHYGLTPAETDVALAVGRGLSLARIAAERGVAVATLRSHIKSVFGKLGVRRQAELAARINEL